MMATSMGTKEELARVVDIIVREGEHRGLTLSRTVTRGLYYFQKFSFL